MIQFIFWAIVCVIVSRRYRETEKTETNRKSRIISNVALVIAAIAVGLGIGMISSEIFKLLPHKKANFEYNKVAIVALGDASEIRGSFFLATGQIGTEQVYRFYYQTSDGGKKFNQLSASQVTVYEEARNDAYMIKVGEINEYPNYVYIWFLPKFLIQEKLSCYAIHVPKGTIKPVLNLDLK
jgi:hypothetical protein